MHLDRDDAVALAGFASPTLDVEGKAAGTVAAHPRFGQLREEVADMGEQSRISGRIGPRSASNRALIDVDNAVQMRNSVDRLIGAGALVAAIEPLRQRPVKRVQHQGGLARSRHSRDTGNHTQRNGDVEVAQVVLARALDRQPAAPTAGGGAPGPRFRARPPGTCRSANWDCASPRAACPAPPRSRRERPLRGPCRSGNRLRSWCRDHARRPGRCCPGRATA